MMTVGSTVPDFQFESIDSKVVQFYSIGTNTPLLVLWLRHFGCRFYQEAKLRLPALSSEMGKLGVHLICVVQGTTEETQAFWPFPNIPVIPDPAKKTYKVFGLGRTSLWNILFPSKELKDRRKEVTSLGCLMNPDGTKQKHSDILQLPGVALLSPEKTVLWIHRGQHTGDLPLDERLVKEIKLLMGVNQ